MEKAESKNSLKDLKSRNRQAVLSFMRKSNAVSVNDISRASGLSKMTVHKIVDYYLDKNVVKLVGKGDSTEEGGKKPNLFSFNPDCRMIFVVRLEDAAFTAAMANLRGETLAERVTVPLAGIDFPAFLALVRRAYDDLSVKANRPGEACLGAVVACNGMVDVDNGVCLSLAAYNDWGLNIPMRRELRKVLPESLPVYVDNWFRYQAYGELKAAGPGQRDHFFIVGTRANHVSGSMVIDGRVYRGHMGIAGEIGHMIVAPGSEQKCVCGGTGCLEVEVAPSQMIKKARSARAAHPDSLIFQGKSDADVSFADLIDASEKGDRLARSLFDDSARHFAVAINNVVQTCDPGTVVIQGDYAKAGKHFMTSLENLVRNASLVGIDKRTKLEYSVFGDDLSLIGAAHMIADGMFAEDLD